MLDLSLFLVGLRLIIWGFGVREVFFLVILLLL